MKTKEVNRPFSLGILGTTDQTAHDATQIEDDPEPRYEPALFLLGRIGLSK